MQTQGHNNGKQTHGNQDKKDVELATLEVKKPASSATSAPIASSVLSSTTVTLHTEKEKTFLGQDEKEHPIEMTYIDDEYGDIFLRQKVASYCDEINKQFQQQVKSLRQPPLRVRIFKVPGDIGYSIQPTTEYKNHCYQEFLKDPRKILKDAQLQDKLKETADIFAQFFMKNDRARAEICKIDGFLPLLKKAIEENIKSFPEEYQKRIKDFDKEIDHPFKYIDGVNWIKKDKGWTIEQEHNFYFFLEFGGTESYNLLLKIFANNSDLQQKIKKQLDTHKVDAGPNISDELKKFLPAYHFRQFRGKNKNFTQCTLTPTPANVYDSNHLGFYDKDENPSRGDKRADQSNRYHCNITSPLRTKADGDKMAGRIGYALQHLDNIFHDVAVPSLSEETKDTVELKTDEFMQIAEQAGTFRVQDSIRTAQSKEVGDMKPVAVARLLADEENNRKIGREFVKAKLQQEGIKGNKEKENFYLEKAVDLYSDNYTVFEADIVWRQELQAEHHNKLAHTSTIAHYKGQAVVKTNTQLVKDTRGAEPPQLLFLIDRSGSMGAQENGRTRTQIVVAAIREQMKLYAALGIDVEIKIAWFDDAAGWLTKWRDKAGKDKTQEVFRTSSPEHMKNLDELLEFASTQGDLTPRGCTSLLTGYDTLLSGVTPGRKTQAFIFSDGCANDHSLSEYPQRVQEIYQKRITARGVKDTDLSMVGLFIVPELYAQARSFMDAVIAPCALRNPTAQNVSLPVKFDLIKDQIAAFSIIECGATYQMVAKTEQGQYVRLGTVNTNQPKTVYSAVSLSEAEQGLALYQEFADGTQVKIDIPPNTTIREMTEDEVKAYEIYLLLLEIESRQPGILFSTESKIKRESQAFFKEIAEEYALDLPWGAKYIAEYFVLGATPSTKAMVECGLIEVRVAIGTGGGAPRPRYIKRSAARAKAAVAGTPAATQAGPAAIAIATSLSSHPSPKSPAKLAASSSAPNASTDSPGKNPQSPTNGLLAKRAPSKKAEIEMKGVQQIIGDALPGTDDMPEEADLEADNTLLAQEAAQYSYNGPKKAAAEKTPEVVLALPAALVQAKESKQKDVKVTPKPVESKGDLSEAERTAGELINAYRKVYEIQKAILMKKQAAAAAVVNKLREMKVGGPAKKAANLTKLQQELTQNTAGVEAKIAEGQKPLKQFLETETQRFNAQFKEVKDKIDAEIKTKRGAFSESLGARKATLDKQIAEIENKMATDPAIAQLLKDLEQKEKECSAEVKKQNATIEDEIARKKAKFSDKSLYVSLEEVKQTIKAILVAHPKEFEQAQIKSNQTYSGIDIWVGWILGSYTEIDGRFIRAELTGAMKDLFEEQLNSIKAVQAGKKTSMESKDQDLPRLQQQLGQLRQAYETTHIMPIHAQISAKKKFYEDQLAPLKIAAADMTKDFEAKEIAPLQKQMADTEKALRAQIIKPVEDKIKEVGDLIRDAELKPAEVALAALQSATQADEAGFKKYFDDQALPPHEEHLVKQENQIDECNRNMQEIEATLREAAKKGKIRSAKMYRVTQSAKLFDKLDELESKGSLRPEVDKKTRTLLETQQEFFTVHGIRQISAEKNTVLTEVPSDDLEAFQKELDEIKKDQTDKRVLRIFGNEQIAVIRVVAKGKIEAEAWIRDPAERKALEDQGQAKIKELLLKHKKGQEKEIQAILARKAMPEALPVAPVPGIPAQAISTSSIATRNVVVPYQIEAANKHNVAPIQSPASTAPNAPLFKTAETISKHVLPSASDSVGNRPRYIKRTLSLTDD